MGFSRFFIGSMIWLLTVSAALASPGCEAIRGSFQQGDSFPASRFGTGFTAGDVVSGSVTNVSGLGTIGLRNTTQALEIVAPTLTAFTYRIPATTSDTLNITFDVRAGDVVRWTCVNAPHASVASAAFLESRAGLLLASVPDAGRRLDRLNDQASAQVVDSGAIMNYLAAIGTSGTVPVSGSLAAIDAMDGTRQANQWDAWIEGTFALFETGNGRGRFSNGSAGVDYRVDRNLVIGGFISLDNLDRFEFADSVLSGTGWMGGPYATARLNENLFIDVLAGVGTASNHVASGSLNDRYMSSRWLVDAALIGQWSSGNWTFNPEVGVAYLQEHGQSYVSESGATVPAVTSSIGQIRIGPGVVHTDRDGAVARDLSLRVDGLAQLGSRQSLGATAELGANWRFDQGLELGAKIALSAMSNGEKSARMSIKASALF